MPLSENFKTGLEVAKENVFDPRKEIKRFLFSRHPDARYIQKTKKWHCPKCEQGALTAENLAAKPCRLTPSRARKNKTKRLREAHSMNGGRGFAL